MNIQNIVKELHKDNLCTYFVLPMLKLNKFRFIADFNFVNSFLSRDRRLIVVQVLETLFFEHKLSQHPNYRGLYKDEFNNRFIVYAIPIFFKRDVELFCNGRYSSMSDKAKELIRQYSGLLYRSMNTDGQLVTDIRLLALEKSKSVRSMWEDVLDCTLEENQELLSIPKEDSFMSIEDYSVISMDNKGG